MQLYVYTEEEIDMTQVITTGNFKGGVGKTTNAVMLSYTLAKQGKKVLLVDLDPQANATDLLLATMAEVFQSVSLEQEADGSVVAYFKDTGEKVFKKTLFYSIENKDLSQSLIPVTKNFDMLPSNKDLQQYEGLLYREFDTDYEQDHYFSSLLEPLKAKYDYVLLDVPPQLNKYTDSALVASDFVIVVLQTQERALKGAEKFVEHLLQIQDDYKLQVDLLGILPVLLQNGADLDLDVLGDAAERFGSGNLFKTQVKQMARLKRFDRTGITDNPRDINDRRVHALYSTLVSELEQRERLLGGK